MKMSAGQRKTKVAVGVVGALGALAAGATASANSIQVQSGDTVWGLSQKYGVSIQTLEEQNSLDTNTDLIFVGQRLQVSGAKKDVNYTVKSGDTLWDLAQTYHLTVAQLQKANDLTGDMLSVGQTLIIPGVAQTTTSSASDVNATLKNGVTQKASAFQAQILAQQQAAASVQARRQANASRATTSSRQRDEQTQSTPSTNTPVSRATSTRDTTSRKIDHVANHDSATTASSSQSSSNSTSTVNTTSASQSVTSAPKRARVTRAMAPSVKANRVEQSSTSSATPTSTTQSTVTSTTKAASSSAAPQATTRQASTTTNTSTTNTSTASSSAVSSSAVNSRTTGSVSASASSKQATSKVTTKATTKSTAGLTSGSVTGLALKLASANIEYVWGGSSLSGMDCSGLVAYVYQHAAGISLPHNTVALESHVSTHSVGSAKAGDLLFWGSHGSTYHVAIYLGNNQFVAAPEPGQTVSVQSINKYFMPSFAGTVNG